MSEQDRCASSLLRHQIESTPNLNKDRYVVKVNQKLDSAKLTGVYDELEIYKEYRKL